MTKTKLQSVKKHPGIYRKLILKGDRWVEAKKPYQAIYLRDTGSARRKREKRSFYTLKEAIEYRRSGKVGGEVLRVGDSPTFLEVRKKWSELHKMKVQLSSWIRYESYLKHFEFFESKTMNEIDVSTMDEWFALIRSPEYLARQHRTRLDYGHEFSVLRMILNYYREIDPTYSVPILKRHRDLLDLGLRKAKAKKDISVKEFHRFLQELKTICDKPDTEFIYYLLLLTYALNLRVQEATALSIEDFNFEKNEVTISKRVMWIRKKEFKDRVMDGTKANEGKTIPISDLANKAVKKWLLKSGVRSGHLFIRGENVPSYRSIEYRCTQALKLSSVLASLLPPPMFCDTDLFQSSMSKPRISWLQRRWQVTPV